MQAAGGAADPSARGETRTGVCASSTTAPTTGAQDWADRVASSPGWAPPYEVGFNVQYPG